MNNDFSRMDRMLDAWTNAKLRNELSEIRKQKKRLRKKKREEREESNRTFRYMQNAKR